MLHLDKIENIKSLYLASKAYRAVYQQNSERILEGVGVYRTASILGILEACDIPFRDISGYPFDYIQICGASPYVTYITELIEEVRQQECKAPKETTVLSEEQREALLTLTCLTGWTIHKFAYEMMSRKDAESSDTHKLNILARLDPQNPSRHHVVCAGKEAAEISYYRIRQGSHNHSA